MLLVATLACSIDILQAVGRIANAFTINICKALTSQTFTFSRSTSITLRCITNAGSFRKNVASNTLAGTTIVFEESARIADTNTIITFGEACFLVTGTSSINHNKSIETVADALSID